jgi:hypothetical protein
MMIRRIAASAAVALGLVAVVPGVALASSAGSAPPVVQLRCPPKGVVKHGSPATERSCCPAATVKKHSGPPAVVGACCASVVVTKHGKVTSNGKSPVLQVACCGQLVVAGSPRGRVVPVSRPKHTAFPVAACAGQAMTFDLPAYSSTATEVSGPRLAPRELVIYKKQLFVIRSVHGHSFTLALLPSPVRQQVKPGQKPVAVRVTFKLKPFTNGATAITDGHAVVLGSPLAVAVRIKRAPLSHRRRN